MKKYIPVKDLEGFAKLGDILCEQDGYIYVRINGDGSNYCSYNFMEEKIPVNILLTLGAIVEIDWKPKQGDVFYTPLVTNKDGKMFTKHIFSEKSECHKRWRDKGLCFFSPELADSASAKFIERINK